MRKEIIKSVSISVIISILLTFGLMMFLLYQESHEQMESVVEEEAGYVKIAVDDYGESYLGTESANVSSSRLTLIDKKGKVLYDSVEDADNMENHGSRPEVKDALVSGRGKELRLSATLGQETFYYALRLENGNVIRVARTTDSVFVTIKDCIVPLVLIFLIVILIAFLITSHQIISLVEPLNKLDLDHPLDNQVYEEISPLLTRINKQNIQIERQMDELAESQEEYQTITENMKDGLLVTDRSCVLSINKKALELFHMKKEECICQNILILSRNRELKQCVDLALKGQPNDRVIELSGRNYQLLGSPVRVENEIHGAVVFLLDVTEATQNERIRREFTANVSHELKTPLMSISGYAELIKNNMVKEQDIPDFAGRIYQEATRLSTLVADIIKLSKLDGQQEKPLDAEAQVDLWSLTTEVIWQLQQKAAVHNIRLKLEGQPAQIMGNSQILNEMLYNLVENGIKYNVDDGSVVIRIHPEKEQVTIIVEDTGIGIPSSEQTRIFERFYRVDKSRSKEIEGTGLGLSIVKHSVALHHGQVKLESALHHGTKITVKLPVKGTE